MKSKSNQAANENGERAAAFEEAGAGHPRNASECECECECDLSFAANHGLGSNLWGCRESLQDVGYTFL